MRAQTRAKNLTQAAAAIGVSAITLKRWLLSGKVAEVGRNRNGWRVFEEDDIRRIRLFAESSQTTYPEVSGGQLAVGEDDRPFTVASFFSGIGGFDLGFEEQGFRITYQCEISKYCRSILRKHWPHLTPDSNIKEVTNERVPVSDVWVGGFPCQDLSLARMGARKGLRGTRSGLFYDFARLVGEASPRVVVIENVPGLLSSHNGRDFGIVLKTLAGLGYAVGWRSLNSRYFGVPQSRERVYIVGCHRDGTGPARILFEPERGEGDASKDRQDGTDAVSPFKKVVGDPGGAGPVVQSIAYCLYACSARHTGTDWSRTYVPYPKRGAVRRLTAKECEGIMAFPQGWTIPPKDQFRNDDLDSLRYHALGNAVTPPIASWLASRIKQYLIEGNVTQPKSTEVESPSLALEAAGG
jgi:DNA (cytosine-5)-methyltransferase 1